MSGFVDCTVTPGSGKETVLQNAIDSCPIGATLVLSPGIYGINRMIHIARRINLWAYGATFDLGSNAPSETLTNGNFASSTAWIATDGWSIGSGVATWDASGGNGLLTQTTGSFRFSAKPNRKYTFRYRVVYNNTVGGSFKLTSSFSGTEITLSTTPGTHIATATTGSSPGSFELSFSGTGGDFAIDDLSLVPLYAEVIPATYPDALPTSREDFVVQPGTDQAAVVWGDSCQLDDETRPERNFIYGLTVTRTTSASTAAERKYGGIVLVATFECRLMDCRIDNFCSGLALTTHPTAGCGTVHNEIIRNRIVNCRYGLTLYTGAVGWVNGNKLDNNRIQISQEIVTNGSYVPDEWELRRVLWHSGLDKNVPNGNIFTETTVEAPEASGVGVYPIGRKLRLEGQDNLFLNDRWENPRPGSPTLNAGDFSTPSKWQTTGGWSISGGQALFAFGSGGAGSLTQSSSNFLYPLKQRAEYLLEYTIASSSLSGLTLSCEFGGSTLTLPSYVGTHRIGFQTAQSSSNFVLAIAGSGSGSLAIDDINLVYQQPDITIGEPSRSPYYFTRNRLLHGVGLDAIVQGNKIEFANSTAPVNLGNVIQHSNSVNLGRIDSADIVSTAHRLGSNVDSAVLGIVSISGKERVRAHAGKAATSTNAAMWGHLEFLSDEVPPVVRSTMGMSAEDYLRVVQHDSGGREAGEMIIIPGPGAYSGRIGLPHGTTPSKPGDLPASALDLYDGSISQMGWFRIAATGSGDHTTSKEVIVAVTQVPKVVKLAVSDRVAGRIIIVKDETGTAGTQDQEIRVQAQSGSSIDGQSEIDIRKDYGYVKLYCNGTNWFIVGGDVGP